MKRSLAVWFILACGLAQARPLSPEPMPEYAMKAAYLYNFALFTEWPALTGEELQLCILGKPPFGNALDSVDGKSVNGRRLTVRWLAGTSTARSCQMLFLGEAEGINIPQLLREIEDAPVLTVTDDSQVGGVMIRMAIADKRLTFEIDSEAARRDHLSISSKLLRLARNVY